MGYYSDLYNSGNVAGAHAFDAEALTALKTSLDLTEEANEIPAPSGEAVRLKSRTSRQTVIERLTVHRNGRQGQRDLTKDTITMGIAELRVLSDSVQSVLYDYEQTPNGRRPGITRPPRGK